MQPITKDVTHSIFLCLFVLGTWVRLCKNVWTHKDRDLHSPTRRGNFGRCPTHWKALAAKGIVQLSITAWLLQPTSMLPTGQCHITWKIPLWCSILSKCFEHLSQCSDDMRKICEWLDL